MGLETFFVFHSCLHAYLDLCIRETVQSVRVDTVVVSEGKDDWRECRGGGRCRFQDWDMHYCVLELLKGEVRGLSVHSLWVYSELLTYTQYERNLQED